MWNFTQEQTKAEDHFVIKSHIFKVLILKALFTWTGLTLTNKCLQDWNPAIINLVEGLFSIKVFAVLPNKQKQMILLNIFQKFCLVTLQHSEIKKKLHDMK